jgi:hypothetical protein
VIKVKRGKSKRNAIYLNNDHGMLENGFYLLDHNDDDEEDNSLMSGYTILSISKF